MAVVIEMVVEKAGARLVCERIQDGAFRCAACQRETLLAYETSDGYHGSLGCSRDCGARVVSARTRDEFSVDRSVDEGATWETIVALDRPWEYVPEFVVPPTWRYRKRNTLGRELITDEMRRRAAAA